nr:PD-(D/E)XK nuclease family protein [uncultured Roseovarius sp.]
MTFQIATGEAFTPKEPIKTGDGSGFAKHGIDHLSASSINLWVNAPDVWVAKYLHGFRGSFGPAPRRGQCVEDAVVATLCGEDMAAAVAKAVAKFDKTFPKGGDSVDKERELIAPMTERAVEALKQYGPPEFEGDGQNKISIDAAFDGWKIPVIGFLDMEYPALGLVIDLKTTTRVPSVMSADHQLQRAIYACAKGNMGVKFLYVSAKKTALLEDGDVMTVLARAKHQIARLERFLAHCDAETALQIVPHNPSSFYWRGDETARYEIFGT